MPEYFEIKPKGLNGCIVKKSDVINVIEECEVDEIIEVTKLNMTEEEFLNLPEFEGF
jgi:hypothetical protein